MSSNSQIKIKVLQDQIDELIGICQEKDNQITTFEGALEDLREELHDTRDMEYTNEELREEITDLENRIDELEDELRDAEPYEEFVRAVLDYDYSATWIRSPVEIFNKLVAENKELRKQNGRHGKTRSYSQSSGKRICFIKM
jgi:chromosome segregation ATPase